MPAIGQTARWRGREYAIVDTCARCGSPVGSPIGPMTDVPSVEYSCRCRQLHPEAFRGVPGLRNVQQFAHAR